MKLNIQITTKKYADRITIKGDCCLIPSEDEKREAFAYRYWISHQNVKMLSPNKKSKKVFNSKGQAFNSVKDAAKFYGIRPAGIYKCISGHAKSFHGLKWSFTKL